MNIFLEEVLKIPDNRRCLQTDPGWWNLPLGDCYFGVPVSESFGWTTLEELPAQVSGFRFYLGSDCENLIHAFTESEYPGQVERLSIGDSSYSMGSGRNYEHITKILSRTDYPGLKVFELGVWELFSNSHGMFGKIGNVTELLQKMPELERLALYGSFDLDHTITLPKLLDLTVTLEDPVTCVNGGFITQATLDHLLESSFPMLEEAFIDLECEDDDQNYTISRLFSSGVNHPNLRMLEFTGGYLEGEQDSFRQSALFKKHDLIVNFDDPE